MSQSEDIPKLTPDARLEVIKQSLLQGLNQDQIANKCGVCRETISRDVRAWKLTGGWDAWIRTKFHDMLPKAEEDDHMGTFREIGKLAARTMTQRTEAKVEGFGTLLIWRPGEEEPDKPEDENQNT